jgi:hypothetical protein
VAERDALFRAIIFAEVTHMAIVAIGDDSLVAHGIEADHIDGAGEQA